MQVVQQAAAEAEMPRMQETVYPLPVRPEALRAGMPGEEIKENEKQLKEGKSVTQYLKQANTSRGAFSAVFANGEKTESYEAACFFMVMQDKGVKPEDLDSYIKIGCLADPFKDWAEIKRIAGTFAKPQPVEAA